MGYYVVEVVNRISGSVIRTLVAGESRTRAVRIEDGLEINLNRDIFYVRIRFIQKQVMNENETDDTNLEEK